MKAALKAQLEAHIELLELKPGSNESSFLAHSSLIPFHARKNSLKIESPHFTIRIA